MRAARSAAALLCVLLASGPLRAATPAADIAPLLAVGERELADGRLDLAKEAFQAALLKAPSNPAAILGLARTLRAGIRFGRVADAALVLGETVRLFERYLELRPRDDEVRGELVSLYLGRARAEHARALPHLERLVASARSDDSAKLDKWLAELAEALYEVRDFRSALSLYRELVERRPVFFDYERGLARAALRLGATLTGHGDPAGARAAFAESVTAFERYLELAAPSRERAEARAELAVALRGLGEWERTAEAARMAIDDPRISPGYVPDLWNQIGDAYYQLERWKESEEAWRRFLELADDDGVHVAENNLAWLLCRATDPEVFDPREALVLARSAVRATESKHAGHLDTLAEVYFALGRYADALETIETAIALDAGIDDAWFRKQRERFRRAVLRSAPTGRTTVTPWWIHRPAGR